MKTKFKDVAHFYPYVQIEVTSIEDNQKHIDAIEGLVVGESICLKKWGDYYFENGELATIKPILKPITDITEDDFREFAAELFQCELEITKSFHDDILIFPKVPIHSDGIIMHKTTKKIDGWNIEHQSKWIAFLCSRGYNVFGLDESEIITKP